MADERKDEEAEVSLSLSVQDWGWLLNYVLTGVRLQLRSDSPARIQVERIVAHLDGQYHYRCHKATQPTGTVTDAATVVLDEMKILDPPEPIAGDSR